MNDQAFLKNVTKSFGSNIVLKDFSLTIPQGKAVCLMGPSGIGKTTVFRLLLGLTLPDTGKVSTITPMSAVFQEDRLAESVSALSNLRLVTGRAKDESNLHLLRQLGLGEEGNKPVKDFSGGMKRRVAVARALAVDFEFLLMDEPFKGLDEETKKITAEVIKSHSAGKTILLISHDADEAALLDADIIHFS